MIHGGWPPASTRCEASPAAPARRCELSIEDAEEDIAALLVEVSQHGVAVLVRLVEIFRVVPALRKASKPEGHALRFLAKPEALHLARANQALLVLGCREWPFRIRLGVFPHVGRRGLRCHVGLQKAAAGRRRPGTTAATPADLATAGSHYSVARLRVYASRVFFGSQKRRRGIWFRCLLPNRADIVKQKRLRGYR